MRLAVLKERRAGETRVAATPETVRKLAALGLTVAVEAGAGSGASIPDAEYSAAGAEVVADARAALQGAGVVFAVQVPEAAAFAAIPRGALLVCITGAMADKAMVPGMASAGVDVAAMELLPRITRAQSMDVLSSQANLAGYRAVIEGAFAFDRGFPMMMTAAGTVPPARVFVVGAGVAGLQAIATARRLGAIVSATDVRPAAKEEIKSLGATFVGVEDTETAGQTGAYAKEMSQDFRRKQAELMTTTVAKNDLVICTALVQGGRAPVLVTQAMVDGMKPGSVVVDIAADGGGNCEATRPGEAYVTDRGVKILGYRNWPGRISVAASNLYAKNLLTFLTTFWDKDAHAPKLPEDDAIVKGVMLTRGGRVVHVNFAAAEAAPAPVDLPPVAAALAEAPDAPDAAANASPQAAPQAVHEPAVHEPAPSAGTMPASPEAASNAPMVEGPLAEPGDEGPAPREGEYLHGESSASAEPSVTGIYGEALSSGESAPGGEDEPAGEAEARPEHEAASLPADPATSPHAETAPGEPPRGGGGGGKKKGGRNRPNDGKLPRRAGEAE
jgi:NAD(P) transhydrogenase subunit alpha